MAWHDRFTPPAPRRGSMTIAQGQAAEAAALGNAPNPPSPFFQIRACPKEFGGKNGLEKPSPNPKGIQPLSPGLRGTSYPG